MNETLGQYDLQIRYEDIIKITVSLQLVTLLELELEQTGKLVSKRQKKTIKSTLAEMISLIPFSAYFFVKRAKSFR